MPVLAKFRHNKGLRHAIRGSSWLMGEQVLRLAIGFLVSLWLARQLGPDGYGKLSYAIAFTSIFAILTTLGLNRILVRELVAHREDPVHCSRLISTAITMRLLAAFLAFATCLAITWQEGGIEAVLVSWIAASFFFSASDFLSLHFQAQEIIRYSVLARLVPLLLATVVRLGLLLVAADVRQFAMVLLLEQMMVALALLLMYRRLGTRITFRRADPRLAGQLLRESWPEIIAGFSGLLFMRLDQIMLQHMAGPAAVGTYAIASRLSEIWYFVPAAIVTATFPRLIGHRATDHQAYLSQLRGLMSVLTALSYGAILATYLLAKPVIHLVYGNAYENSAEVLLILIWCGLFVSMGLASGSWIMAEKRVALNLWRNLAGALINIFLNLALIPRYGALGAAYATLIAMATAYFAFDFIVPAMKPMRQAKLNALLLVSLLPWRRQSSHK